MKNTIKSCFAFMRPYLGYFASILVVAVILVVAIRELTIALEASGAFTLMGKLADMQVDAAGSSFMHADRSFEFRDWVFWLATGWFWCFGAFATMFALPAAIVALCYWCVKRWVHFFERIFFRKATHE